MIIERAQGIDAIRRMSDSGDTVYAQLDGDNWQRGEAVRMQLMGLHRLALLRYLEAMDPMAAAVELPLPQRMDACIDAAQNFNRLPPNGYARAMVFEGHTYTLFEAIQLARSRTIQAALLTMSGQDIAADALPQDPFTGAPITITRRSDRIVAYSFGRNRRDDGGISSPDPAHGPEGPPMDFVFEIATITGMTHD
jgi:hypothetical protein